MKGLSPYFKGTDVVRKIPYICIDNPFVLAERVKQRIADPDDILSMKAALPQIDLVFKQARDSIVNLTKTLA
jgi:hypothetical protein